MKSKKFSYKGASILVLQEGDMVMFYMNYITECDAISIWSQYFDITVEDENALISYHQAMMEAMEKQQKSRKKRKK